VVVLGLAVVIGWYGPWNAETRYQRMSLLGLRHLVDREPKNAKAWRVLALRLAHDGDAQLAEPALREAMAMNPDDAVISTGLGELLVNTKRAEEGFQILKMTTGRHPDFLPAHLDLGRLYRTKGSYHHAAAEFEAAVAGDKKDPGSWYLLAQCYLDMQQVSKAQTAIQQALALEPKNPHFLMFSGHLLIGTGQLEEGLRQAREAAALAPQDIQIQGSMATLVLQHHRTDEDLQQAEQIIGSMEQMQPDYPMLPQLRGDLEALRQHWEAAARYYEKARETVPGQDTVFFSLAQAYRRLGRSQEADQMQAIYVRRQKLRQQMDDVRVAIGGQPENAALYRRLAELQFEIGNNAGAMSALETALSLDPHSEITRKRLEQLKQMRASSSAGGL
jgi:predicted Zn-dependent protease